MFIKDPVCYRVFYIFRIFCYNCGMTYDYLIVGGGIAGVTAAETIREHDRGCSIGIFEYEPYPLYSRVLLPSYLKHRIPREKVFLRTLDDFTKKKIDISLDNEAVSVNAAKKEVTFSQGEIVGYHKLLLAAGGRIKPWGREEDQGFVYRLQTLDDADRLIKAVSEIRRPLVVGASFISLEFIEIFLINNILPALLVRDAYFFGRVLDPRGGEILHNNFDRHGVRVSYNDSLAEMETQENALHITTRGLRTMVQDALAVGIGLDRNTEFLHGSGIGLGERGVRTNEYLETNQDGVYAAGDIAEFYDATFGAYRVVGNWSNAFLQGKCAGYNMVGDHTPFRGISTYSITNLGFQITVLGESDSSRESIIRTDMSRNQYERFFIDQGKIRGAVLINRFQDKPHLARLMEGGSDIGPYRDRLADMSFDIHEIPVVE